MRRLLMIAAGLAIMPFGCEQPPADEGIRSAVDRGPVHASVTVSSAEATAGERIAVSIEAQAEADVIIATPLLLSPEDAQLGGLTVLQSSDTMDLPLENGGRRWTQELVLDSFEPGEHEFPAITIEFKDERSEPAVTGQLETEPLTVTITSTLSADAELNDIRGWIDIPGPPWWPWVLTAGSGLFLLGGIGLWLGLRDRVEGPPPTAAEIARAAMRNLRAQQYLQQGEANAFYTNLSGVVRQYIEGQFGLRAPQKTTDEFLRDAERDSRLSDSQRIGLHDFLRAADLVKFAMHEPNIEQGEQAINDADHFIDEVEAAFAAATTPSREAATC
jgi:hypothetical protein